MPTRTGRPILRPLPARADATAPAPGATPASGDAPRPDAFDDGAKAGAVGVYFTPDDNAYAVEEAAIDEVIAARRADPTVYPPGESPYKVLYMVFNLRNKDIAKKLMDASEAGVDVQVLVEADQIADDRPWNKVDEWFEARGMTVIRSDKDLDDADKADAHLIGIDKRSLMHMKSRIFRWKDPDSGEMRSKVMSGSLNPGGAPVINEENLNVFDDDALAAHFEKRFYEVRAKERTENVWDGDKPVNVLFTPQVSGPKPTDKLFEWIDDEKEMILISVFALRNLRTASTSDTLVDKLKKAQARGVTVAVITDRRKSDGKDEKGEQVMMYGRPAHDDQTDELLEAAGIPVYELVNTSSKYGAVHGKSAIFGLTDMKVMTGAGNWTIAAMGDDTRSAKNEESFVFIDSGELDDNATGRVYLANFLHLLRKYDEQTDESAEDTIAGLQKHAAWPRVGVDFAPVAAAQPGREVFLVSDDPRLRDRVPAGAPGVPITPPATPPLRPAPPLDLPFGTTLDYRVATKNPDTGELEHADPGTLLVVDTGRD
jgi:hypothetical protein